MSNDTYGQILMQSIKGNTHYRITNYHTAQECYSICTDELKYNHTLEIIFEKRPIALNIGKTNLMVACEIMCIDDLKIPKVCINLTRGLALHKVSNLNDYYLYDDGTINNYTLKPKVSWGLRILRGEPRNNCVEYHNKFYNIFPKKY